jgi:hypothetical protein
VTKSHDGEQVRPDAAAVRPTKTFYAKSYREIDWLAAKAPRKLLSRPGIRFIITMIPGHVSQEEFSY